MFKKKYGAPEKSHTTSLFLHGWACALADLNRLYDQPTMVEDVMRCGGITVKDLRAAGVDDYDIREIVRCIPRHRRIAK